MITESSCPPVLFTIFNRPDVASHVFEAIRAARPKKLFVSADAPREGNTGDVDQCQAAQSVIKVDWPCEVHWLRHSQNLGCKFAMLTAIDWFFEHVDQGIILEEDCVPTHSFFGFCNELLNHYRNDDRIFGISGNTFIEPETWAASYYFLYTTHIWGWATWRDRWKAVDRTASAWPAVRQGDALPRILSDRGNQEFWSHIIDDLHGGQGKSWSGAIVYTMLKNNLLGVHPRLNLVSNIGFGVNATNATDGNHRLANLPTKDLEFPLVHPPFVGVVLNFDRYVSHVWGPPQSIRGAHPAKASVDLSLANLLYVRAGAAARRSSQTDLNQVPISGNRKRRALLSRSKRLGTHEKGSNTPFSRPAYFELLSFTEPKVFLQEAYRRILGREVDDEGLRYYLDALSHGSTRTQVITQLLLSINATGLLRLPTWLRVRHKLLSLHKWRALRLLLDPVYALVGVLSFEWRRMDDLTFLRHVYFSLLNRPIEPEGLRHYETLIASGHSRWELVADIYRSPECDHRRATCAGLATIASLIRLKRVPLLGALITLVIDTLTIGRTSRRLLAESAASRREILAVANSLFKMNLDLDSRAAEVLGRLERLSNQLDEGLVRSIDKIEQFEAQSREASLALGAHLQMVSNSLSEAPLRLEHRILEVAKQLDSLTELHGTGVTQCTQSIERIEAQWCEAVSALGANVDRLMGTASNGLVDLRIACDTQLVAIGNVATRLSEVSRLVRDWTSDMQSSRVERDQLLSSVDGRFTALASSIHSLAQLSNAVLDTSARIEVIAARSETYAMAGAQRVAVPCGKDSLLVRSSVGYVLCPRSDSALLSVLLEAGELEPGIRKLIQRALVSGDFFIDIGANIGLHTIAAARAVGPTGRVLAFEPHPQTADLLKQTIWLNGLSSFVEVFDVALGDQRTRLKLNIGRTSGHHSLLNLEQDGTGQTVDVCVQTLDEIVAGRKFSGLVKIDVEGFELNVLEGMQATLGSNPGLGLLVECGQIHLKRVGITYIDWVAKFVSAGFDPFEVDPQTGKLTALNARAIDASADMNLLFCQRSSPILHRCIDGG